MFSSHEALIVSLTKCVGSLIYLRSFIFSSKTFYNNAGFSKNFGTVLLQPKFSVDVFNNDVKNYGVSALHMYDAKGCITTCPVKVNSEGGERRRGG